MNLKINRLIKEKNVTKKKALISVSDKTGLADLAKSLLDLDYEIISTGGTAKFLKDKDIKVTAVEEITGFPECFDGRVKTLHPKIHGGLLARRDLESHMQSAFDLGISMIDLVVVNLYPFAETMLKQADNMAACIEQIDIGGPAMLRSAAKNYNSVVVLTDVHDYQAVIHELETKGEVSITNKLRLAAKVFAQTAFYDSMIAEYLNSKIKPHAFDSINENSNLTLSYQKVADLRYGENPAQKAAIYSKAIPLANSLVEAKQLHGKELSYNNYADTDAAMAMVKEFSRPTVVAVKHSNPCGIASADSIEEAWQKAYQADPVSIFGGIIVQNRPVTKSEAEKMAKIFLEVILAPSFEPDALEVLMKRKNIRLLELPGLAEPYPAGTQMVKEIYGGILLQDYDQKSIESEEQQVVTKSKPEQADLPDYYFAMKVVKHVKSNAIVLIKNEQTVGIGPGQPNRITSANIAIKQAGELAQGSIMGSDAFFPFADTVEAAYKAGVKGIIQPGGSLRDQDSIDFCDQHDIPMIFTGARHFKH
ncbi:MAG TPA: bifunctional phosphoribosylaminoimidazolecarboxamide formyltransferase/IMP cyclohydrolase [Clostridiaceae bacterium]|nr:bifunctional phosphoribosylaminoimidazolecarboxamide formyltransferase/IMP cyclohydrolase [Clostridiaceae bacterium]